MASNLKDTVSSRHWLQAKFLPRPTPLVVRYGVRRKGPWISLFVIISRGSGTPAIVLLQTTNYSVSHAFSREAQQAISNPDFSLPQFNPTNYGIF
jgi:hypothetical protein